MLGLNKHTLFVLIVLVLPPERVLAWADMGHGVVGAVAEETMSQQAKDFVRGILGVEPLVVAATWADHVKNDERFAHRDPDPLKRATDDHDFNDYHFCEIPTGMDYDSKPNKDVKDCYGIITNSIRMLKDIDGIYSREEKMIALRYLVHVMGDIHQPLHVGNGFDLGGSACQIHWKTAQTTQNLHVFWDDTIVTYLGGTYADSTATPPRKAASYMSDYVPNFKRVRPEMFTEQSKKDAYSGNLKGWLLEGQQLRESVVYPDDPTKMAKVPKGQEPKNRPYCAWYSNQLTQTLGEGSPQPGKIPSDVIPILTEEQYGKSNAKVVETQLIKAGLRLAATLDEIASEVAKSKTPSPMLDDAIQEKILKSVQSVFRNLIPNSDAK